MSLTVAPTFVLRILKFWPVSGGPAPPSSCAPWQGEQVFSKAAPPAVCCALVNVIEFEAAVVRNGNDRPSAIAAARTAMMKSGRLRGRGLFPNDLLIDFVEILDRVQRDGILRRCIFDARGLSHRPSLFVGMVVAANCRVVLLDRRLIGLAVAHHPLFELRISWFVLAHEVDGFLPVEAERCERHRIKARATLVIALG